MNLFCIIDCFVIYVTGVLTPDLLTCGECISACRLLALPSTKVGVFHAPAFSCDGPLSRVASLLSNTQEGGFASARFYLHGFIGPIYGPN